MGDIVILLRSLKEGTGKLSESAGPAGHCKPMRPGRSSLFDTTEAQVLLATLKIIDNPHRDVDFVAALASPVFGVSSEELARSASMLHSFANAYKSVVFPPPPMIAVSPCLISSNVRSCIAVPPFVFMMVSRTRQNVKRCG